MTDTYDFSDAVDPFADANDPFSGAVNPFSEGGFNAPPPTSTKDLIGSARDQLAKADEVPDYNMVRGAVERGGQLLGGVFRAGDALSKKLEEEFPMGGLVWEDGILPRYFSAEEYQAKMAEGQLREPLDIAAESWKESDAGYVPNHTWEAVKDEFSADPLSGSAWGEVAMYAAEQGIKSVPDMAAAVLNLPAYIVSRSGEMGEARAENKGKDTTELDDVLEAMPFALASAALERVGAKGITDAGKEALGKDMLKAGFANAAKRIAQAGGKAAGKEAVTEYVQEGIIEYAGERLGTNAQMTLAESFDQGLAGAVAGGGYGGAAGTTTASAREYFLHRQRKQEKDAAELADADREVDAMMDPLKEFADANNPFKTAPKRLPGNVEDSASEPFSAPTNPTMTVDSAGVVDPTGAVSNAPPSEPVAPPDDSTRYQWLQQNNNAGENQTVLVDTQTGEIHGHHGERLHVDKARQSAEYEAKIKDMISANAAERDAVTSPVPLRDEPFTPPRGKKPSADEITAAAAETNTSPSGAQIEADNYKKGRTRINGFDIAFENPKGSVRSGVDEQGNKWESTMAHHYGDIKGHKGADGDDLDVFIGDSPESEKVYVIDQVSPDTGKFDEHKIMMGFNSLEEARAGYLANYEENWQGLGEISELHENDFKSWVKGGKTDRPFALKPTGKKKSETAVNTEGSDTKPTAKEAVKPTDKDSAGIRISASNKPFASDKAAKASIRANLRNGKLKGAVENYEVVPVTGGFGYREVRQPGEDQEAPVSESKEPEQELPPMVAETSSLAPVSDLSKRREHLTDAEIHNASESVLRFSLSSIADDHFRGLSNVHKTTARKAWGGVEFKYEDARSALIEHRDYWRKRKEDGEAADLEFTRRMDALYQGRSNEELEGVASKLEQESKASRSDKEFDGNGGRRSGAATSNEASRSQAEQARDIRRYITERSEKSQADVGVSASLSKHGVTVAVPSIDQQLVDDYNNVTHVGRGRDVNAELRSEAERLMDELSEKAHTLDTDQQKESAQQLVEQYLSDYADFERWNLRQGATNPSWMVTGRSNMDVDRYNRKQEAHGAKHQDRFAKLELQRKQIASTLHDMRPQEIKDAQSYKRDVQAITDNLAAIIEWVHKGAKEMTAETRKWASPDIHKLIEKNLETNRDALVSELKELDSTTAVKSAGGLVKVVGPRSKAGKLIGELLENGTAPEKTLKPDNAEASSVAESDKEQRLKPADFIEDASLKDLKAGPYPLKYHNAVFAAARDGDLSLTDFNAAFETLLANEQEIKERLNRYRKNNLMGMAGRYYFNPSDYKKPAVIEHVWERMRDNYLLDRPAPEEGAHDLFSDTQEKRDKRKAAVRDKIIEQVQATTEQDIADYAEGYAEHQAEQKAAKEAEEKALKDPQTLEEFKTFISKKSVQDLSGEQLVAYDALMTEQIFEHRAKAQKAKAEVAAVDGEVSFELTETQHTKTGEDLYVVKLTGERLDKEAFSDLRGKAKQLGGFYSSFRGKGAVPGFQFKAEEDRAKFVNVLQGGSESSLEKVEERQAAKADARVAKLLALADRSEARASEVLNQDRKTNTARRAAMAASVEARAESEIEFARLLKKIAEATEAGELKVLSGLSAATQLQELNYLQSRLVWAAPEELIKRDDLGTRRWKSDVSTDERVKFAKLPTPKVHVRTLRHAAEGMAKVKGYKQTAKSIESRIKSADPDAVIDLGHYKWDGVLPKIKQFASLPGGTFSAAGKSYADAIKQKLMPSQRLEALGINSLPMLRTALRELYLIDSRVSSASSEKTKLQMLERDLKMTVLNNRKAFNDFFPTTETIANDVVALADIEPGMTVLEPSAGNAMLADAAQEAGGTVDAVELAGPLREILTEKGYELVGSDFLDVQPDKLYDRVVMNPPFSKDQDIQHVAHAYNMLKPGGKLVAIVSIMAGERQNKRSKRFSEWLDELGADQQALPEDAFKSSLNATAMRTKVVVIDKPDGDSVAPDFSDSKKKSSKAESVTVFSTGKSGSGVPVDKVKQRIAKKVLSWDKGPIVEVVQSVEQLSDHIQQQIAARNIKSPHGLRDGYDGTVYIVAGNLRNLPHADRILSHEAVGHFAMERMLGEEFDGVLNKVQYMKETDSRIKKIAAQVNGEGDPYIESAEIVAKLAEQDIKHPMLIKAYAALRKFLKKLGFNIQFGLPELKAMLVDAAEYLRTGKRGEYGSSKSDGGYEPAAAAFSQESKPEHKESKLFSRTKEGKALEEIQFYSEEIVEQVKKLWKKNWTADYRPVWLGFLTRRHLADIAGKTLPQIKRYVRIAQEMDARRNELMSEGAKLAERWTKYNLINRKEARALADLMHDATLAGVDPSKPHEVRITKADVEELREKNAKLIKDRSHDGAGGGKSGIRSQTHLRKEVEDAEAKLAQERNRAKARPGLERRWKALSPEAQAIFIEVRDAYKKQQESTLKAVEARIGRTVTDGNKAKQLMHSLRAEYESVTVEEPYFPLARFGKYWVDARKGDERVFDMFETTAEQEAFIDEMRAEGYRIREGAKLDDLKQLDGVSAKFVTEVETMLTEQLGDWPKVEAIKDDIYQMYLQSLPDLSVRKHFRHRKKVKGFAKDALRVYAESMFRGSYQLARLEYSDLLQSELEEMHEGLKADLDKVNDELKLARAAEGMVGLSIDSLRSMNKELTRKLRDVEDSELELRLATVKLAMKHKEKPEKLDAEITRLERIKQAALSIGSDHKKATHLYNEMLKRHEWAMNPKGAAWANTASSIGFTWYLGVSPAAALVNVTQTPMVAYPMLAARFGWKESADALMNASNNYFEGGFGVESKLSGDRLKAYREAVRSGVVDKTLAHDLAAVSQEGATYNPVRHKVMSGISFLFHNAERYNREVTYMAAYDLARNKGYRHAKAIEFAHEFTWDSHFDYSSGNKARFMQGDVSKVILMFRQFSLNMTYLLARNAQQSFKGMTKEERSLARRQLGGILGMHFLFAGAMGLPLWSVLSGALNAVFDDEDEPWDFNTEFRNFLADNFGKEIGHAIAHGPVQALTGQGVSSRVSLDGLWWRDSNRELEGRDQVQHIFEQILGPMGGIAMSMGSASDLWREGHHWRAVESSVPKFAKDGLKAIRYWDEGVNTLRGDSLVESLDWDKLIAQASGLTPAVIQERYEANNAIKKAEARVKSRRQHLMNLFALAYRTQDTEGLQEVKKAIVRFNSRNRSIAIMPYQLVGSIRRRARYSHDQIRGIVVDRKLRYLTENGRFAE